MKYNHEYFAEAQKVIMGVLTKVRPELMEAFGKINFTEKEDKTVVTELDKKVENLLKDKLRQFDPEIGFLGEEYGQEGNTEQYWLIDPIDGTESFIRGIPVCRNQLAFMSGGEAVFAVAYQFPEEKLFVAHKGKGTTLNGEPVDLTPSPLENSWIDIGMDLLDPDMYALYQRLRPHISGITVLHNYLAVVEGQVDGIISAHGLGGPWDYEIVALLLQEAGMRVASLGSDIFEPNSKTVVATYPENFDALQKLLSAQA